MTAFLQFALIGVGLGSGYALFAQGAVLIYRGSGIVNFGHGAVGALAAYVTFMTFHGSLEWPVGLAIAMGILCAGAAGVLFQVVVLRQLRNAAPITRLVSTLGFLMVVQGILEQRYGKANHAVAPFLPHDTFDWGGVRVQEQVLYIVGITAAVTAALWAFTRFSRTGLAITAIATNERAVRSLGWSPHLLSTFTWGVGAALAGLAGILVAPLTGLSPTGFTLVVTVAALASALLGGFKSFPWTLAGGLVVGIGESLVTLYGDDIARFFRQDQINGLNRAVPFLVILLVLVVQGRGLPLRSHITDRLPRLGSGQINVKALLVTSGVLTLLLFTVFDDRWAAATYISLASAVVVLSIVVLTGYAGQLSLGQWAMAGVGALIAGSFVARANWPIEVAIPVGVLLTVPVGLVFALPALRTRGVNLAVVTLGLGFAVAEVVFTNSDWIGGGVSGGTPVGEAEMFGVPVDAARHPRRWALVCLVAFVLVGLVVANLRRSRTGRRLIAVRTNERAAASLGISVFGVKLYAFGVAAAIAGVGGILVGFQSTIITYDRYNVFESISSVSFAVIGGLGYVIGAAFAAPNAVGGLGTRIMEDLVGLGDWATFVGGVAVLLIIILHQDGIAAVAAEHSRPLLEKARLAGRRPAAAELPETAPEPATPVTLGVQDLTVRFGGVVAVSDVSFTVHPGEVVGLIGPNGAGKTTIIDAITGFVKASSGRINLDDDSIDGWSATRRARRGLRRSFQSLELFEDTSVEDNIRAGADSGNRLSWVTDLFWPGRHVLPPTAVTAITEFELEDDLAKPPTELPYGRRRLVGIARAVASGPSVILLDEPAAGLDEVESRELAHLVRRLAHDRQMGVLLVEHDVGFVMSTCDRIIVLDHGAVIAHGTPAEIRDNPAVREAYLGAPAATGASPSDTTLEAHA